MKGPPALPFALTVGVTGHRADALPDVAALRSRVTTLLQTLEQEALAILAQEFASFADVPPCFTLVSPLASGADQIAAACALDRGWRLQAILPVEHEAYGAAMGGGEAEALGELLGRASCILQLPGQAQAPLDSFVMAGRATVAHCDLLIAVWDGLPARGRGGTAETVDLALARGSPVLHLPVDHDASATWIWSAFDPVVVTGPGDPDCRRPADPATTRRVLTALLAPPDNERERLFIERFAGERPRRWRWRIEYPLLMILAGTRRPSRRDLSGLPQLAAARSEWAAYGRQCVGCHGVEAPLDQLQEAYLWSDRLASHFAQTYRSGHVFNFLMAALGAWIGLSGLVLTINPLLLAIFEFVVVASVVANTLAGSSRCWHQRWLDYRQLAERLRPMRSLKLLGIAAPDPPGTMAEPVARRWIDWYAAAMWRTIGCPAGGLAPGQVPGLAQAIAGHEVRPQVHYNRSTASEVKAFDRRLEAAALTIFAATLAITLFSIGSLLLAPALLGRLGSWVTVLSAGLPALGTAIFGIRVQGDFGALAARALTTAEQLERIAAELETASDLTRAADLTEQAARVMLADLGEWRLVNELHELSLG